MSKTRNNPYRNDNLPYTSENYEFKNVPAEITGRCTRQNIGPALIGAAAGGLFASSGALPFGLALANGGGALSAEGYMRCVRKEAKLPQQANLPQPKKPGV